MDFGPVSEYSKPSIDVTGTLLTPSPLGCDCLGNGEHEDEGYECCCDECDYYLECFPMTEEWLAENMPDVK